MHTHSRQSNLQIYGNIYCIQPFKSYPMCLTAVLNPGGSSRRFRWLCPATTGTWQKWLWQCLWFTEVKCAEEHDKHEIIQADHYGNGEFKIHEINFLMVTLRLCSKSLHMMKCLWEESQHYSNKDWYWGTKVCTALYCEGITSYKHILMFTAVIASKSVKYSLNKAFLKLICISLTLKSV